MKIGIPSAWHLDRARVARWGPVVVFPLAMFVEFVHLRGYEIRQRGVINPDEADLLAAGKLAAKSLIPYERFTTTSYGPLWPMFLGVLHRLGLPLTLPVARLLAACFGGFIVLCLWAILWRRAGRVVATCATVGLGLMWGVGGIPTSTDFTHLSSELLPTALLCLGAVLFTFLRARPVVALSVAVLLFALTPAAKYQFAPLGGLAILAVAAVSWQELGTRRTAVTTVAAAATPYVLLLVVMLAAGTLSRVRSEALPAVTDYVGQGERTLASRLSDTVAFGLSYPFVLVPVAFAVALTLPLARGARPLGLRRNVLRAVPFVLGALAAFSASVTPTPFAHYSQLSIGAGMVAIAVVLRGGSTPSDEPPHSEETRTVMRIIGVGVAVLGFLFALPRLVDDDRQPELGWRQVLSASAARLGPGAQGAAELGAWCPAGSTVVVWGWAAEMYSYFDWTPGTRFTINTWQLNPSDNQARFRDQFWDEVERYEPRCIVEAVGPAFFAFRDETSSLGQQFPDEMARLGQVYTEHDIEYALAGSSQTLRVHVRSTSGGGDQADEETT